MPPTSVEITCFNCSSNQITHGTVALVHKRGPLWSLSILSAWCRTGGLGGFEKEEEAATPWLTYYAGLSQKALLRKLRNTHLHLHVACGFHFLYIFILYTYFSLSVFFCLRLRFAHVALPSFFCDEPFSVLVAFDPCTG